MKNEKPYNKAEIRRKLDGTFEKGQGGPGRPKGQTMKEFAREFLMQMDDEAKRKWLNGLAPDIVWRMAEGNPHQTTENEHKGEVGFVERLVKE